MIISSNIEIAWPMFGMYGRIVFSECVWSILKLFVIISFCISITHRPPPVAHQSSLHYLQITKTIAIGTLLLLVPNKW